MAQSLPPGAGVQRPATVADWEAVPAPYTAHLIDGVLYAMGRPLARHAMALRKLAARLEPFDPGPAGQGPGGWLILPEVDVRVRQNIVSPDLAGWRRERMATLPDETPIVLRPDWVCEVLSPSTHTFDRGVKATWYASVGVEWMWIVDPEERTLEAFVNDEGAWRPAGRWAGEGTVVAPPFDAVPWALAGLWG